MIFVLYFVVGSHFGFPRLVFCSAFGAILLDGFVFCRPLFSTKSPDNYIRRANLVEPNHHLIFILPQLFTGNWMIEDDRRTFGSQTSDLWKCGATVVRAVREEKESEEKESAERRSRCAKRYKSSETLCFFHGCVAPEGRKVGSPKRRVRSHLVVWEIKNCRPLWCEAHFEVKMLKTPHVWSTFRN